MSPGRTHDSGFVSRYFRVNAHRSSRVRARIGHRFLRTISRYSPEMVIERVEFTEVCRACPHAGPPAVRDGAVRGSGRVPVGLGLGATSGLRGFGGSGVIPGM